MPTPEEQAEWLATYPDGNIGLPLGPCSGLVAVDIDTDNEEIIGAIQGVLPQSPWRRVGKKGCVMIYKWRDHKTARIRDENDKSIVEILSRGTQIVIPPSIHPDTGRPYYENMPLLEVLALTPVLPGDADIIIRGSLADRGVKVSRNTKVGLTTFVPAGSRDNALVSNAGLYAMAVARGERTLKDALSQMRQWVEGFTQKVIGDEMSVEKAEQKVVEFLISDVKGEKKKTLPIGWDEGLSKEDKERLGINFTEENEAWDYDRAIAYLDRITENTTDFRSTAFQHSIEYMLGRIAQSGQMTGIHIDVLLKSINERAKSFTMLSLRKRLRELGNAAIEGNDHAEIAEALFNDLCKFSSIGKEGVRGEAGKLWRWEGAHWAEIPEDEIFKLLLQNYARLPAAKKAGDHLGIRKVLQRHAEKPLQVISEPGLNFANGFLTTDLKLRPHDPDFGMTYVLPYRYVPERWDRASLWTEFLYDVWGRDPDYEQKVLCLQEAIAATLFGIAPRHQRCFALIGASATGKSTVRMLIEKLLPEGSKSSVNPGDWNNAFLPAEMFGKLLNVAGELSEKKKIGGAKFKEIVCGETQTAQRKNGQPFQFKPKCAQWFSSNHPPDSDDSDDGFSRRWLFWFFNHKIPLKKRITDYEDVLLAAEREEIVAWAIQALPRLLEHHYTIPPSSQRQEDQLTMKLNSVQHFIETSPRVVVGWRRHKEGKPNETAFAKVYLEYLHFCTNTVLVKPVTSMTFRQRMQSLLGTFEFEESFPANSRGAPMPAYKYLTLVDGKAG
jgi:putative DNA primase/helicase